MRGRIAWSRSGFLAYIDSTHAVRVTWLRCVEGKAWEFAPPMHISVASEARPLKLAWSSSNFDLAIADELGRVQIVTISGSGTAVNQIVASGVKDQRLRPVELDRVVTMHWLGIEKNLIAPHPQTEDAPASKAWNPVKPLGPFPPKKGLGALVCVNGNGMLRLLVEAPDHRYVEVDALIPGAYSVLHAVCAPNSPESLLLMLVGKAGVLQVYEATVRWHPENLASKQDFVDIEVHPIAVIPLASLFVSDLRTVTAYRRVGDQDVVICAVADKVIARYTLSCRSEALHASFFELFGKSTPVQPDPHKVWVLNESVVEERSKQIKWFVVTDLLNYIIYEDGTLETESLVPGVSAIRLDTMKLTFAQDELAGVSDLCLSPTTTCAAVYRTESEDKPALARVKLSGTVDQEQMRNIARLLATEYAYTVFNSEQCDDLLNVCRELLNDPQIQAHASLFFETLASEAQRLLTVSLSAPEDTRLAERFIMIPSPMQRWLSLLITLGTSSGWHRTPGCRLALCILNLQLLGFSLLWTLKKVARPLRATNAEQLRLEIAASQFHIAAMLGPIRWATDLIARICQELYNASVAPEPPTSATYRENGAAHMLIEKPNVYASLVFSSLSRFFLRYFLRGVHNLTTTAKNLAEQENKLNNKLASAAHTSDGGIEEIRSRLKSPLNFVAAQTLKKLVVQLQAGPVQLDSFDKLLVSVDEKVKALVAEAKVPDQVRYAMDAELVKLAKSPSFFMPVVDPLMETVRTILIPALDVPELYFYDTTWIGLDETPSSLSIDSIRKRIIMLNEPIQQCTRCGMQSVPIGDQGKPHTQQWFFLFHRHCLCGGSFIRINAETAMSPSPRSASEASHA